MFLLKGNSECALGKMQDARQSYSQGATVAQNAGMKELSATVKILDGVCESETGNAPAARQRATEALALADDHDTRMGAAFLFLGPGTPPDLRS